jgi:hypothetical protein
MEAGLGPASIRDRHGRIRPSLLLDAATGECAVCCQEHVAIQLAGQVVETGCTKAPFLGPGVHDPLPRATMRSLANVTR